MITINHNQLARALFVLYRANVTPMIIGPSGVGKSQAVQEFARKVTDASDGHQYWQSQLSCLEAPDLMGVPFEKDGRTAYLPPENMPGSDQPGIWFIDETLRCTDDVHNATMRIVHERVLGNVQLSHQLFVILADNGNMDRYTITPSESFIQRCCWLYLEPDKDTWVQWAESTGVHPNAMAYAKSRWENVSAELQYEDYAQSQSWLTRRCGHHLNAIEQVLDDLHGQIDVEDVVRPLVQGCIGAAEAIEYIALRGGTDVTYDEITAGTAAVPSTIDHCNLILSSVIMPNIAGTNQSGCELVAGYIKQWPREAAKTAFTAIAKGCPGITDTAAYMAWDIPF